ncbi:hypothetical protein [Anaerocolumna sedimenticola]|nr:hypothetical protein [Anaerocolumna sedimenticola]
MNIPALETERLIIRALTLEEFEYYGEYSKIDGTKTFKAKFL